MEENPPLYRNGTGQCAVDPAISIFVTEYLQHSLAQSGYQWRGAFLSLNTVPGSHSISPKVAIALRTLADEFTSQYKDHFVDMCEKLVINEDNLKATIQGVANELFSEGIKWPRIVALFVFGSELALHCVNKNWVDLLNVLAYALSAYISEQLLDWIKDHGGWEGLIRFEAGESAESNADRRWPSVKNLLCLGISALGVISLGAVLTKSITMLRF